MKQDNSNMVFKALSGTLNNAEKVEWNDWLNSSEENKKMFSDYKNIWNEINKIEQKRVLFEPDMRGAWLQIRSQLGWSKKWIRLAASVAVLLTTIGIYSWMSTNNSDWNNYTVSNSSSNNKVQLPDGSMAYLSGPSQLGYPDAFDTKNRRVKMEGEIFFEIQKDPEHPFIVQTEKGTIEVLGTSFAVNTKKKDNISVHCLEGKVKMTAIDGKQEHSIVLTQKEMAQYETGSHLLKKQSFIPAVATHYNPTGLRFKNATLQDVIQGIQGFYGIQIKVENSQMMQCLYTSALNQQDIQNVLSELELAFKFTAIKKNEKEYILRGGLCK